ncbi:MAG: polysaccharide export protein [Burkholderiales bacterium]|nr:polysaccharide export protein [Opitutaceae bacterium]
MHIYRTSQCGLAILLGIASLMPISALVAQPSPEVISTQVAKSATTDYLLRPSDILQVKVFQEDDLTREVSISREFELSLPLIGAVNVRNRSVRQVEELIRQLYDRDYLVNPQVSVIVLKYAERAVNVIGSVNSPQAVEFPAERGLTLLEAITRAGGFSRLADKTKVKIIRTDEKGVTSTFSINTEKLMDSNTANLWSLQVDDVIQVPEKFF